ncbi:hypothetical protein N9X64_00030 [bacterium]|nr:hypothetical protein [bacterium]
MEEGECPICNDTFFAPKGRSFCSKFCADVSSSVKRQLYSDKELTHLMLLNRGFGFSRFSDYIRGGRGGREGWQDFRLLDIIETQKEETKIDLFEILQDPSVLITMKMDEWLVKGRPPAFTEGAKGGPKDSGSAGRNTVKKMKDCYARYEQANFAYDKHDPRTHRTVRVYPQFNWGPYSRRTRRESN